MNKRIFAAIDVSEEARKKISNYIETLRREFPHLRVGWDKPEKLHLTLKFLGETNEKQLENLTEAVVETANRISRFKLRISGTGVFPSKRNARVLWLGVTDERKNMQYLNEVLERECEKRGFLRERRNFTAHLTVARLREPQKSGELIARHLEEVFETEEFEVSEIAVYESRLQAAGSIYSIVSKYKLKEI